MVLGATLAEAARRGRDKITFVISQGIETFADWVEQLIAESTGKEGKGLLPVAGEDLGAPEVYGQDRIFVHVKLESEAEDSVDQALHDLETAGHPVVRISLHDKLDLGQEFFRWEVATATAGALLGIDPFDQPNVQESKGNTGKLLEGFRVQGNFSEPEPLLESNGLKFYGDGATRAHLANLGSARQIAEGSAGGLSGPGAPRRLRGADGVS